MNKTSIKFYTGLDTIGAVIMEVKYGNDRAFFEAGTAYNPSFDMFDEKVIKRKSLIKDYLWVNEIPPIDYIYRKEDIEGLNIKPACEFEGNQAFFITHLHLDHMRMMGLIDPIVPVYLTKSAQTIEKALEDVNLSGLDSFRNNYEDIPEDIDIGQIHVHKFILNADSYQDLSFYIETPDLKIHYTGDIFVYGKYYNNIQNEIKYLNNKQIDVLVPEGTTFWGNLNPDDFNITSVTHTFNPTNLLSKDELDEKLIKCIKDFDGLVVFNYYEREMSDVMDFMNYAKKASRTLVFEPESAYIINKFFNVPVNVMIPDTYKQKPSYFDEIINFNTIIHKNLILMNPDHYLVQNSYPNLMELIDYRDTHTLYLHHSGIPLGAFDPKYQRLKYFIEKCGFEYQTRSSFADGKYFSSHATREQLLAYLDAVHCKLIVPVHSANRPAYVKCISKPYYYANLNTEYEYDQENNTLKELSNE